MRLQALHRYNRLPSHGCPLPRLALLIAVLASALAAADAQASPPENRGEAIYHQQCASCHGEHGEGVAGAYDDPLTGDRAVSELAEVIDRTMPEDDPAACTGDDAALVAAYIYDAFYSPMAQIRNAPPQFELARLTTPQYRNSVADLLASFTGRGQWSDQRGLQAEYYADRRFRREERKIQRVDAAIDFDFGAGSPIDAQEDGQAFSVSWQGGLLAPDTGLYRITVQTPNAAVLKLNNDAQPLIDAKIRSGDRTEYSASIFLLGGRVYPIELEYYRSEYGSKEVGNTGSPTASIRLRWQPPGHTDQTIPSRYLDPGEFPEVFVVETPFPPDDSSVGYARGTSVSRAWDDATTDAALAVGRQVVEHLDRLAGSRRDADDREPKVRAFCERFAERAMRGPLSDAQRRRYVDQQFEQAETLDDAVRRCVLLVLKSPQFLYPELPVVAAETSGSEASGSETSQDKAPVEDAQRIASRLALALWDSLPDDPLIEAFEASEADGGPSAEALPIAETIAQQAQRMVDDLRTRAKLREFMHHWLRLEHAGEMSKDAQLYPDFGPATVSDLRHSLDLFVQEVIWSESADFRELLTSDAIYLNRSLAEFYGVRWPEDAAGDGFQRMSLPKERSAGVLSHPLLMAGFAYTDTTSPIHRGVFLARNVLGRSLRPPPEAVSPLSPDLHADLSTRQRVALQTKPEMCSTCHTMINPLGFALEHFDPVGRYRTEEKGKPINARGTYRDRQGEQVAFDGVRQLAEFLADSPEAHEAFVRHLFEHTTKQPVAAYGMDRLEQLRTAFAASEFNIQALLVEIATVYAAGPAPPAERVAQAAGGDATAADRSAPASH